jgi:hypothetical protein
MTPKDQECMKSQTPLASFYERDGHPFHKPTGAQQKKEQLRGRPIHKPVRNAAQREWLQTAPSLEQFFVNCIDGLSCHNIVSSSRESCAASHGDNNFLNIG